ncbi:hypothetical protein RFI_27077 [Reticulomyxa filosa]|uniref:Uncharacterized protein n=1 Tax=Reticulomyxa filosa TaxID=46433 RepID=X6MB90_RETFI|nr:hypothetical protein RFI_27077 [Reticulomyxa filosa]|eukprot:ETO10300.1 hypothetical protein RFI_27077 [Reticulomyxa filosa]
MFEHSSREGETEGTDQSDDQLSQFLKSNGVKDVVEISSKLRNHGVTLEGLLEYGADDIKDICQDCNISALSRADLLRCLRKVPTSYVYKEAISRSEAKPLPAVIITSGDREKMEKLYEQLKGVSEQIHSYQTGILNLEKNATACKKEVKQLFEEWNKKCREQEEQLLVQIDNSKKEMKKKWSSNLDKLQTEHEAIKHLVDEIQQHMCNEKEDINEKSRAITSLLQNSLIEKKNPIEFVDCKTNVFVVNTDISPLSHVCIRMLLYTLQTFYIQQKKKGGGGRTGGGKKKNTLQVTKVCGAHSDDNVGIGVEIRFCHSTNDVIKSHCVVYEIEMQVVSNDEKSNAEEDRSSDSKWINVGAMPCATDHMIVRHHLLKERASYLIRLRACYNHQTHFSPYSNIATLDLFCGR